MDLPKPDMRPILATLGPDSLIYNSNSLFRHAGNSQNIGLFSWSYG